MIEQESVVATGLNHSMRLTRNGREETTVAAVVITIGFVVGVKVAILYPLLLRVESTGLASAPDHHKLVEMIAVAAAPLLRAIREPAQSTNSKPESFR